MVVLEEKERYNFYDFVKLIEILRSDEGCPWDREQTHSSIRKNFIEETYEACEAIDKDDKELLKEELGDVMLQILLHSQIESEKSVFTIDDVIDRVYKKIVYRHPHVFSTAVGGDSESVLENWDKLKKTEKGDKFISDSVSAVPASLPALMRAQKIIKRASSTGANLRDIDESIDETIDLLTKLKTVDPKTKEGMVGDMLFSAVNTVNLLSIDSEEALYRSCDDFTERFARVEKLIIEEFGSLEQLNEESSKKIWKKTK